MRQLIESKHAEESIESVDDSSTILQNELGLTEDNYKFNSSYFLEENLRET